MRILNQKIETILANFCAFLMALMVIDVTWQVLSRYLLSDPSSFTEELARFLLIWIGFMGAAYAYRKYAHLGLDIFTAKLKGEKKLWANRFSDTVVFAFSMVVMLIGGAKVMLLTLELQQLSPALQIKMGYVYSVIPLSGALICIFAAERILLGREQEPVHSTAD
ncbi:TRAP-type C4-dicarboxylate transport system, small permease component [Alteromonadaceae bacterium Bs31]|nr:TRAP-type C4-dicarboxylate transport system, small permease component [Alteromonadaceae bacterium Bs31]